MQGIQHFHYLQKQETITFNPYPSMVFALLFSIFVGILFSFPSIFEKIRRQGKWKYDCVKMIAVGIPSLLVALTSLIYFSPMVDDLGYYSKVLMFLADGGIPLQIIAGIVFGFVVINCFRKGIKG
ncbi:MAG TPA: hypothetical protein VFT51_06165 [Bacillales bacterium]|nr:hypothetical protein [Bacillales bacterium]